MTPAAPKCPVTRLRKPTPALCEQYRWLKPLAVKATRRHGTSNWLVKEALTRFWNRQQTKAESDARDLRFSRGLVAGYLVPFSGNLRGLAWHRPVLVSDFITDFPQAARLLSHG